jgi:hypothetical protein
MARYTGPKVRLSRRVGAPIEDNPKHTSKRQLNPPGMHGFRAVACVTTASACRRSRSSAITTT